MTGQENMHDKTQLNKYLSALGLLILSSIYIPLAADGTLPVANFASIVSIICFVLLFVGGKKISRVFPAAIVFFILYAFSGSATAGSIFVAAFTSVSLAANELASPEAKAWQRALLYTSLPIAALVAYFVSKNIYVTIASLLPCVLFTALGLCARKKVNRKRGIIILTAILLGFATALVGAYMLISKTDIYGLRDVYISARDGVINHITNLGAEVNGEYLPLFEDIPLAQELLVSATNILPAMAIVMLILISYFLYNYQMSMMARFYGDEYLSDSVMKMDMSAASAAVCLLAFIFSFTTDSHGDAPFGSMVCQNIYIILTPALVYAGFTSAKSFFKKKNIRLGLFVWLVMGLLAMSGLLFMILAFIGILCIFGSRARAWAESKD